MSIVKDGMLASSSRRSKGFQQPPLGNTERFLDVVPVEFKGKSDASVKFLDGYEIADFGRGMGAVQAIVAHVLRSKFHTEPQENMNIDWCRVVAVETRCKIIHRPTGKAMHSLRPSCLEDIDPEFAASEGESRGQDIAALAQVVREDKSILPKPLYIAGALLQPYNTEIPGHWMLMLDGARRISAHALAGLDEIDIVLLLPERMFPSLIPPEVIQRIQQHIDKLSWFPAYQDIPLLGIKGQRTLNRFDHMDCSLFKDQKILDFGCNLGQSSLQAVMAGAENVVGLEGMEDTCTLAQNINKIVGFNNLEFHRVDFNDKDFEEKIDNLVPFQADYSFFFSVYRTKELTDRDRLFRYIISKTAKGIFFEGHAHPRIDTLEYYDWLFDSFGLPHRFLGYSEGTVRPLFYLPLNENTSDKRILVSAIVSTYKAEEFIESRIRDLLSQTIADQIEIIVIDSNSPESEGAIISEKFAHLDNIRYLRTEERESVYKAWNRGIKMARGTYVTNANTDDRLRPDAFEIMAAELEKNPKTALVYGDFFITNIPNQTFHNHVRSGYSLKPEYAPDIMLTGCHMGPQPMWRKEIHKRLGYFDEQFLSAGDYEFWCRIARHFPMKHIRNFLGLYYNNPQGIVNSSERRSSRESESVKQRYASHFPKSRKNFANSYYCREDKGDRYANICMVTFNRLEFTRESIHSIVLNTKFPHVLTVIDNGSTDGTVEYLNDLKNNGIIHNLVLLPTNVGVAKAANLGWLLEPEAEYYVKFDNDIVIEKKGWLTKLVEAIERVPMAGAFAYNFEIKSYPVATYDEYSFRVKEGNLGGACILIPKRTFNVLGYWCEDYGLYGEEDADYGQRIMNSDMLNCYMEDEYVGIHLPGGRASEIDENTFIANSTVEIQKEYDYRKWKDKERIENIHLLQYNFARYKDQRNLFIQTTVMEYLKENTIQPEWRLRRPEKSILRSHPGKNTSQNKLKVTMFHSDSEYYACREIRFARPVQRLSHALEVKNGTTFKEFTEEQGHTTVMKVDMRPIPWADMILINRFFPMEETEQFMDLMLESGKPVIYETDDLLTELPRTNSNRELGERSSAYIFEIMKKADAVIVSSQELKKRYKAYNKNIYIYPNYIDENIWGRVDMDRPIHDTGAITIGYAGTLTHYHDLAFVEDVLAEVAGRYENIYFKFFGCATDRLRSLKNIQVFDFKCTYTAYADLLQKENADIMLCPLEDNAFNRCKSNIKWLEYAAAGKPGIYSNLPPYACIENRKTGLVVNNDPAEWFGAIQYLIENPGKREAIRRNAYEAVMKQYTLEKNAGRLLRIFETIHKRSKKSPRAQRTTSRQVMQALPAR